MNREALFRREILESIQKIRTFTSGGRAAFLESELIQNAVIRNIEIIGEAAKNVPEALRGKEPSIPWRNIAAMRNHLIHRYFRVDLEQVWQVVAHDLDALDAAVNRLLSGLSGDVDSALKGT